MERFRILTITEQLSNQLAQGEGGKVILANKGDVWYLENIFTTEGGDFTAIVAPGLGMLPALANLTPVFRPGCEVTSGALKLSLDEADKFPWAFEETEGNGLLITAREASIPDGVSFPSAGGKVFLVWDGAEVKWVWNCGRSAPPPNSGWLLEKVEDAPQDDLEEVAICAVTGQEANQLAQDGGKVMLAAEGDSWLLENVFTTEGGNTKTIFARSSGLLQALASLSPVFLPHSQDKTGEVKLISGQNFPWKFNEVNNGMTITAREANIPEGVNFPTSCGTVYLAWEDVSVKWLWAQDEVPENATWKLKEAATPEPEPEHEPLPARARITYLTLAKLPPNRSLAQDTQSGGITLTDRGSLWYLNGDGSSDASGRQVRAIVAPSLGLLQILAQLYPVFPDEEEENRELRGQLSLRAAGAFEWVFTKRDKGYTITALESSIPSTVTLPAGGQVYITWLPSGEVQWQWSGGAVESVPDNAIWSVEDFDSSAASAMT